MGFSKSLEKAWYRKISWALLLLPLSWVFRCIVFLRKVYIQRCTANPKLNVPVIVVGNISVGGTGKTPLLITLVQWLQQQGYRPGVISRGYGGHGHGHGHGKKPHQYPYFVSTESSTVEAGDEPLLLAKYCPVMVDPDRYRAAKTLLEQTDCDLILSDDGLQHYRLPRDIEIVLVDAQRVFGNGQCLPAGPLREPASRLVDVDFVIANGTSTDNSLKASYKLSIVPIQLRHLFSNEAIDLKKDLNLEQGLNKLTEQEQWGGGYKVHAVAGIGNPQRFVQSLEQLGFEVQLHAWPDHHVFNGEEFIFDDDLSVIITAKDAVKCSELKNDKVWVLDVSAQPDEAFFDELGKKLMECRSN
jgi:tetraacyldisaccharide 4'-kinase